ncbi:MAG: biopolymer transporter ExbD, partial [Planctomycetota bacterium]|nr:biopolymer transporter ExbD [Planctomycetota bacterium]
MISRRRTKNASSRVGVNLTPMIDVVFQLMIYFLLATNFALGEQVFKLDLPERGSAAASDPFDIPEEPLRILVGSGGADGEAMDISVEGPYPQPDSLDSLEQFLIDSRAGTH